MIQSLKKILDEEMNEGKIPQITEKIDTKFEAMCEILKELRAIENAILEQTELLRKQSAR